MTRQQQSAGQCPRSNGTGPWYNATGALVANNAGELHARPATRRCSSTSVELRINGQWTGSPSPVQHDILTGSNADGTLMSGFTCADWSSASAANIVKWVIRMVWGPGKARPARWRHRILLTPIRIVPTPHRAAAPAGCTALPGKSNDGLSAWSRRSRS